MAEHHREGFPKSARLRQRHQFLQVQQNGQRFSADCILALVSPNTVGCTRLGLTVSSKVGNAVVRNRIRRHLREWYRKHGALLPKGIDVVLIARNSAATASADALNRAFVRVAKELSKKAR